MVDILDYSLRFMVQHHPKHAFGNPKHHCNSATRVDCYRRGSVKPVGWRVRNHGVILGVEALGYVSRVIIFVIKHVKDGLVHVYYSFILIDSTCVKLSSSSITCSFINSGPKIRYSFEERGWRKGKKDDRI